MEHNLAMAEKKIPRNTHPITQCTVIIDNEGQNLKKKKKKKKKKKHNKTKKAKQNKMMSVSDKDLKEIR